MTEQVAVDSAGVLGFLTREAAAAMLDSREDSTHLLAFELGYSTDKWLEHIERWTFASTTFAISLLEAKTLYRHCILSNAMEFDSVKAEAESDMDNAILEELTNRLNEHITSAYPQGCFVKTSLRSPKDSPLRRSPDATAKEVLRAELQGVATADYDAELLAFQRTITALLRAMNGKDAISILAGSQRVQRDLKRIIDLHESDEGGLLIARDSMFLTLRAFSPCIAQYPMYEFRGFIHKNRLTALSQYNDLALPRDVDLLMFQKAGAAIVNFFQEVWRPDLPGRLSSSIVDFFCLPVDVAAFEGLPNIPAVPGTGWRVWVIELNPFFEKTGACLFDWRRDRSILFGENIIDSKNPEQDGHTPRERCYHEQIVSKVNVRTIDRVANSVTFEKLMRMLPMEWVGAITSIQEYGDEHFNPGSELKTQKAAAQRDRKCAIS